MASTQDVKATSKIKIRSTEELRAEMYRLLDELSTARDDRAKEVKKEFEVLWKDAADVEPTVH